VLPEILQASGSAKGRAGAYGSRTYASLWGVFPAFAVRGSRPLAHAAAACAREVAFRARIAGVLVRPRRADLDVVLGIVHAPALASA